MKKKKTICKKCQILDEKVAQLKKWLPGKQKHWAWNPEHSLKAKHGKFLLTPVLGRGWSRALLISQSCCIFVPQFLLGNSQSHKVNNPQWIKNNQNEILKCEIRRKRKLRNVDDQSKLGSVWYSNHLQAGRMRSSLEHCLFFQRTCDKPQHPHEGTRSSAHFWPLWTPSTQVVYRYTCRENTGTHFKNWNTDITLNIHKVVDCFHIFVFSLFW